MWKFKNFTAAQILREITFGNFAISKTAMLVILDALNFDFWEYSSFESVKNTKKSNFKASKTSKTVVFDLLKSGKIDFT